ncbi:TonB-dependent receptor [Prevotella sp.]|uniref:TonB-dependent receptor n=1 Tax=Prevotella sp. TaxID=59823 RepID=UPI002648838B|nr:TonB-dependent receptor [Prevotella sp.]MDN5552789.1 outer membrane beta-barrel protein [Prevotella sp.]
MDKRITIALLLFLSVCCAKANTYSIKGKLISNKDIVDYASVILQKQDSSFVSGVTSDKNGQFIFENINNGDYKIVITSLGFDDKSINIKLLNNNIELGNISMESATHQLNEVVVSAAKVIRTSDKQVALPTKFQIKASTNGIDLLRAMQLSRLHINPIDNTISSSAQGEVQTRINGAKVDMQQIKALRPEEIQRIEYHDNPGMKYGQNVACVIDYITKRPVSGGTLSLESRHSPFDGWGEDQLSGSYNKGKSQIGVSVWQSYRNLHQWRDNTETFNYQDGSSFTRMENGQPDAFKMNYVYGNIYYNYKNGDKWYINTTLNLDYSKFKTNTSSTLFPINDRNNFVNMLDINSNNTTRPWLDIYFQRNFNKNSTLIFDVVGTYIRNDIQRNYTESKNTDIQTDINSTTKGNKHSIIAEAIYSIGLIKTGSLSFGLNGSQAYTSNDYTGTVNQTTNMHDGYARSFAEWKHNIGKFNYSFGAYFSYIWMLQGSNRLYQTEWYPKASMSYTINDKSYIKVSGERSYKTPSLSDISNVEQVIDSLQIRRGNPNLSVSHTWMTNLYYEWRNDIFNVNFNMNYLYQQNPVMEETLREGNKFIRTQQNQKSWQSLNPELGIEVGPLFKLFTFNITTGMNYYDSYGFNYHHYYTNWYYDVEAMMQYKNLTLLLKGKNHCNSFYGETMTSSESLMMAMARYKIKKMSLGLIIINPFSSRQSYNLPTINYNSFAPSHQTMHIRESARLIALTLNWDISFGRKYDGGHKLRNNEDKDSGAIKSGK